MAVLIFAAALCPVFASDEHQSYALDKLVNAQAQLNKLEAQRQALEKLIRAVKKDLAAAKIRTKAEKIQIQADTARQDAAVLVEQAGVAVDLPNLMTAKDVQAGVLEDKTKEEIDKMFKDNKKTNQESVFFPGK